MVQLQLDLLRIYCMILLFDDGIVNARVRRVDRIENASHQADPHVESY